jgi:hypothetical protein
VNEELAAARRVIAQQQLQIYACHDVNEALAAIIEALDDGDPTATTARQIAAHAGRNAIAALAARVSPFPTVSAEDLLPMMEGEG